jgi:hypothetical protein
MKNILYRLALLFISVVLILVFANIFFSCSKEEEIFTPEISLEVDPDYISQDTTVAMGSVMRFKVNAECEQIPITNFVISYNNGNDNVLLDSGLYNTNLTHEFAIYKGVAEREVWTFTVMNLQRQKASFSINIDLLAGGVFNDINTFTEITLGAQDNQEYGCFYSFATGQNYSLEEAFNNQSIIDILYYYDIYESTLSSPNENDAKVVFTGTSGLENWTTLNEARYHITNLNYSDFEASAGKCEKEGQVFSTGRHLGFQ